VFDGVITSFAKLQARMQVEHPSADLIRKPRTSCHDAACIG
jgi:hypothetical protein